MVPDNFMENESTFTPFDRELQSRELMIFKTMIPYLMPGQQRMFALMIKFMELQKTASLFNGKAPSMQVCSSTDPQERISQMLADIRGYCTPKEQENIDMALNMIQMLSTYEVLFN